MRHSYSSYSTFNQCAAKWYYQYVEFKDAPRAPPGPAAQRGTAVHESIDRFMNGESDQLHKDIHAKYGMYLTGLKSTFTDLGPEEPWALDQNLQETDFKAKDVWIRGFYDLGAQTPSLFDIYEWKTGRVYETHADQRFLYGMSALTLWQEYEKVTVTGVYFDQGGQKYGETYERKRLTWMQDEWKRRLEHIENAKTHAPTPSYLCKWCDFSKAKNGPCKF